MKKGRVIKEKWLNVMLHFSAFINSYKVKLSTTTGPKIIWYGVLILLLELANFFLCVPLYAFIRPEFFAGNDKEVMKVYRLRRVISLSVLGGILLSVTAWIAIGVFGVALFPNRSHASQASWDFNNSLAYHYDATKLQIVDGTVVFKATETIIPTIPNATTSAGTPTIETPPVTTSEITTTPETGTAPDPVIPAPEPTPTPAPVVEPAPAPSASSSPLLFNPFNIQKAFAEGTSCSATLEPIAPLVVASFDHWTSFSETANKNTGDINYQLSSDGGVTWKYFNGSSWVSAGDNYNNALEINNHINSFPTALSTQGVATLSFRALFTSDCTQDVTLLSLTADYTEKTTSISSVVDITTQNEIIETTTSEQNQTVLEVSDSVNANTDVINVDVAETLTNTTEIETNITTPIAFSIHTVIKTNGTAGHTLYSIPGIFKIEGGPDNGLVIKVTDTSLAQTTLTTGSGASAHVSIGDHIVVITYDDTTLKLYIDGAVSTTVNMPIVIAPPSTVSTSIGCTSAGFILETLTLAQINANYLECSNHKPVLDITNAIQKIDDDFVDITYTITDQENNFVSLTKYEYSLHADFSDAHTMTEAIDTDHSGTAGLSSAQIVNGIGATHAFVWNIKNNIPDYSGNVYVRIAGTDGLAESINANYGPFHIDTIVPTVDEVVNAPLADTTAPFGLGNFAGVSSDENSILWDWSPADDEHFDKYVITYGKVESEVANTTGDYKLWGSIKDSDLSLKNTDRTIITGLSSNTIYYAKISAMDTLENTSTSNVVSFKTKTLTESAPNITEAQAGPIIAIENSTTVSNDEENTIANATIQTSSGSSGGKRSKIQSGLSVNVNNGNSSTPINNNQNTSSGNTSIGTSVAVQTNTVPTNSTPLFTQTAIKILSETKESTIITKPAIATVQKSVTGKQINFTGTGIPNSKVALFIHSDQVVVYATDVDKDGKWNFVHDQNDVKLAPGEHTVFAVTYDEGSKIKSKPSIVSTFEVKQNMASVALSYTDLPTTILTTIMILFGAVYIWRRKIKVNNN